MFLKCINVGKYVLVASIFIGILSGCQYDLTGGSRNNDKSNLPTIISTGTSFGLCVGYCEVVLSIDNGHVSLVASSFSEGDPNLTYEDEISADENVKLLNIIGVLDTLPDVVGCPDCADGGSEWIEKRVLGVSKRVTIECGAQIEMLANLLGVLRPIRSKFYEKVGLCAVFDPS
jgi:hypothetical protein